MSNRELDALVAREVMGFDQEYLNFCNPKDTHPEKLFYIPQYSTDISAAWEVVEKSNNHTFKIEKNGITKVYSVQFGKNIIHDLLAPKAICLAALKAVGVELESKDGT